MYITESDASFASIELHQKPHACKAVAKRGTKGEKIPPVLSSLLTAQCIRITGDESVHMIWHNERRT